MDSTSNKRLRTVSMDTQASTNAATQTEVQEIGMGNQVVTPPRYVPHLFNDHYTVKLTYTDTFQHDIDPGYGSGQTFRMNSIYDCDYTGGGHQPNQRDVWANLYDYYTVLACEYEITMYNGGITTTAYTASDGPGHRLGSVIAFVNHSTDEGDIQNGNKVYPIGETKNVQDKFLQPDSCEVFRGRLTPGDFQLDAKDSDSDGTWTAVGANAAIARYFGYRIIPALQGTVTGQNQTPSTMIHTYVKIHYTVQFAQYNPGVRQISS